MKQNCKLFITRVQAICGWLNVKTVTSSRSLSFTYFRKSSGKKTGTIAAHLQSLRLAPTSTKDTPMLRINSKHYHFNSNSKLPQSYIFITIVHIYGYVSYTYPWQMFINVGTYLYGTKLIRTRAEPLQNKRVFTEDNMQNVLFYIHLVIKYKSTFF